MDGVRMVVAGVLTNFDCHSKFKPFCFFRDGSEYIQYMGFPHAIKIVLQTGSDLL